MDPEECEVTCTSTVEDAQYLQADGYSYESDLNGDASNEGRDLPTTDAPLQPDVPSRPNKRRKRKVDSGNMSSSVAKKQKKPVRSKALSNAQRDQLMIKLKEVNLGNVQEDVLSGVTSAKQMDVFPERKAFWEKVKLSQELKEIVRVMMESYLTIFSECGKRSMPYTHFQIRWHKYVSTFILEGKDECNPQSLALWEGLVQVSGDSPTFEVRSNLLAEIGKIVYACMNTQAVKAKSMSNSTVPEATVMKPSDEVSLFRIAGACLFRIKMFCLKATRKTCKYTSKKLQLFQGQLDVIQQLEVVDKEVLPYGYRILDKGNLLAIRPSFIPFLSLLDVKLKQSINSTTYTTYRKKTFSLARSSILADHELQDKFSECCATICTDTTDLAVNALYVQFLHKYCSVRCNEFLTGHIELDAIRTGKAVEVMLRDKLKAQIAS